MTITISKDGTLKLPREILETLGTDQVDVRVEGNTVVIAAKRISDYATPTERAEAVKLWIETVGHETGTSLPEDYDHREDMYP